MRLDNFRQGQKAAFDVCMERLKAGESTTSIVLPTRYGKSDLIRVVALESLKRQLVAGAIALSPGIYLRDQLAKPKSLISMADRYDLNSHEATRVRIMRDAWEHPFQNNEYLISCTFELATRNIDRFVDLADSMNHRIKKPVLFFIDECHETSQQKKRGEFVSNLIAKGCFFILVTATPIRADGEMIPGFKRLVLDERDARRYVVTDAQDGVNNRIDVYDGKEELVVLDADHTTTYGQAWEENPCSLCHLTREVVDVDLSEIDDDSSGEKIKLSQAPMHQARRCLSKAIRNHRVIENSIDILLNQIERAKRVNPKCAAIIFTGNDGSFDAQDNAHAKQIKRAIEDSQPRYGMDLDIKIATMKSENDEKAVKVIQQFVGNDADNGRGDILIVKQMGGRGIDVPRVKIVLDLSSVRTVASVVQRLMRCATPYSGMNVGTVITLADPLMDAIWKQQIFSEGGEKRGEWNTSDLDWKESYLKPKEEEQDKKNYQIDDAYLSMYDDSHGFVGDMELRREVERICNAWPILTTMWTMPEIAHQWRNEPTIRRSFCHNTVDNEIEKLKADINTIVGSLSGKYIPGSSDYVDRYKYFMNKAKRAAGVLLSIDLKHITSIKTLQRMLEALHGYRQEDFEA